MQKWEYKEIVFVMRAGIVESFYEDMRELRPKEKNTAPTPILDYYGSQGWELVAREGNTYTFKHPL